MYLALFLAPWVLGYALSTIVMGHAWTAPQPFVTEGEMPFEASFPPGATPRDQAEQILAVLDLDGAFGVQSPAPDGRLTINRQGLLVPRRIVYEPAEGRLTIERAPFQSTSFLNRFHHRRTYQSPYLADQAMALSIDAVVVAMVFWSLSGIWMWWEMRTTRPWGVACVLVGATLFGIAVMIL
jgi:hypothetical protein